ncbi:RNA-splicing ligase RtcB [Candidatus Bathyarchaeota archaeon]|nr:RNA-splicing ligase RtcB [Candidatus Bathyarchaeota archaeon]
MNRKNREIPLERIDKYTWRIPKKYKKGMRVPGRVYADDELIEKIKSDRTLDQCANVAHLPGIYKFAITLPDGHEGYGFPIGGVAATDYEEGVISPGGVGYDINCGVRLLTTNLTEDSIRPELQAIGEAMFQNVPSGLGSKRKKFRLSRNQLENLVTEGAPGLIEKDMGWAEDAEHCEEKGCLEGANPDKLSDRAKERGLAQVGTLGSGNHFLEVQKVDKIYDPRIAKTFGIVGEGQVTVMIHTGSRGFGHQVCSDYLRVMERALHRYSVILPDRELACAPGHSKEAQDYYQAMACAVNYAFSNRQAITHWVRESFKQVYRKPAEDFGLGLVYDVAHNIAKQEDHDIDGKNRKVWIHRKGATRAFGPGHEQVPAPYQSVGQPVFIPGSMGTSSWLMVGKTKSMNLTFGSTAHGAGRLMSRAAAKRRFWGGEVKQKLEDRGMVIRSASKVVLAEEAAGAYKDVDKVAEVSEKIGVAARVVRLVPLAVVKG